MAIRMRKKLLALAAVTLITPLIYGLGLGEITIHSKLNQPLDADIEVTSANSDELSNLVITVPSDEIFNRYDIERLAVFGNLNFSIKSANGRNVINVTSRDVIKDPFLTFLVEANWPQGRLLREYTVLVDPPLYIPQATPSANATESQPGITPATTSNRNSARDQGSVRRDPVSTRGPSTSLYTGDSYLVKRGDTLSGIAKNLISDSSISVNQTMIAIYRNNSRAFDGNINRLKAGYTLDLPDRTEINRITRDTANQEVRSQVRSWRGQIDTSLSSVKSSDSSTTGSSASSASTSTQPLEPETAEGKLVLKVPDLEAELGSGVSTGGDSTAALDVEGEERIKELAAKVEQFERLLAAKDNELAALQQQLDKQYDLNTETTLSTSTGPDGESTTDPVDTSTEPEQVVDTTTTEPEVEPTTSKPPAVVSVVEEESGLLPLILKLLGGGVGLGLLGLLGFMGYRKFAGGPSRDSLFVDEDLDVTAESIAEQVKSKIASKNADIEASGKIEVGEASFEELGMEPPKLEHDDSAEAGDEDEFEFVDTIVEDKGSDIDTAGINLEAPVQADSIESDEALPFEDTTLADVGSATGSMQLDQSDPLAETDFHMAYGLYDQAADLMQSAIQENDSFEFKEKLLEVFFVSGNKEEFLRYATEIKDEAVASHPGSWDNIVIMGKQLAPDESLFSGDVSAAGLDESLDFSLGSTGSVEVDSSLFQDQSEDAAGSDDVLDFNIMDPQDEGTVKEDVVDLDLNIDLPDAPVDLEEAIEDFSFDLNATLNEDVDISDSTAEVPSPLAEWDSGSSQEVHEVTELTPELAMKLESLEDNTLTAEINMADLDMDIGSATETTEAADIDLPGDSLETVSSSDMDLDISELGLSAAADAAFDVEDLADQTLDFAFDLDESDDIELTADATENSEGLSDTVLEAINSETVGATTELKLDDNFDLLLDEGSDDTANAALDMDLDNMFDSTSEADPFPDDTLQNMLPDGVSEHDSGTMQLSELNVDDRIKPSEIEEVLSADDPYASTAQITEDELAAMGLSNEGPDMNEMTGLSATLANDVDEVGTKLDLARAYIEMDDPDNAKSILQEVIEDGNDTQRKEANDILLTLS